MVIRKFVFVFYMIISALPQIGIADSAKKTEKALLAGGCFWGMEEAFRKIPGVEATRVGYTGGSLKAPNYNDVSSGTTGHAESIEITFDPKITNYKALIKFFFRIHDPTSLNRQGNDTGTQYRSAIFYFDKNQKKIANSVIKTVNKSKKWKGPVVTKVSEAGAFYPAEEYHQKYLLKNPDGYNDHYIRDFNFD